VSVAGMIYAVATGTLIDLRGEPVG
jgi:hypothetical protein